MRQSNSDLEPEIRSVFITDQLESLSTFGIAENGEGVFIPAVVARAAEIEPGDTVKASLMPNSHATHSRQTNQTPWFAMHVHGPDEDVSTELWERLTDEVILATIQDEPLTTREIAETLDVPRTMVHSRMNGLFRDLKVVKSMVFNNPKKGATPAAVLWGINVEQFLGEEE